MSEQLRGQMGLVEYVGGKWGVVLRFPGKEDLFSKQEYDSEEEAKAVMRAWAAQNADTVDPMQ